MRPTAAVLVAVLALCLGTHAFYLPGVAPRSFTQGELLPLQVNRLDSTESVVPYDYYFFDFCEPGETVQSHKGAHEGAKVSENLGQVLLGERIRKAPHHLRMLEKTECQPLCRRTYSSKKRKDQVKFRHILNAIRKDYMNHWILDNLPVVECTSNCLLRTPTPERQPYFRMGFPVGCAIGEAATSMTVCTIRNIDNMYAEEVFINNHVDIVIDYHKSPEFEGMRIVGVRAMPRSIRHADPDNLDCSSSAKAQPFKLKGVSDKGKKNDDAPDTLDLIYTYSVYYTENPDLKWASRWDTYLQSADSTSIHWFSIINSVIIVLFLSGMLGVILVRTLHKDIARYNQAEEKEEAQEEFGWKLVHGDVFRAPARPMLLSALLGTGVQLFLICIVTLFFACLGFLSPATRGGLMTATIVLWVCLGAPAGYVSARMYKMMGGELWRMSVLMTAGLVPGIVFSLFFVMNILLWAEQSSAAVPFGTLVALMVLWFFISVPLTFIGAYSGFRASVIEQPVRTNQIPRQIPVQSVYTRTLPAMLMGGILPFGCIFIQLFFILNSIWGHKMYYVFGFLMVVFVILVITTIESTILLCYFHLCSENYHWWWRSFLTGGASAFYLFLYEIIFYFRRMEVSGSASFFLYTGYSIIAGVLFLVLTGTLGFFGSFAFVRRIYSIVKVD